MQRALFALLLAVSCFGQSALTTISDTYTNSDGSHPGGTLTISWQRTLNDANPRQVIPAGNKTIVVTNGVVSTSLFPNTAMLPTATCYRIAAVLNGQQSTRFWSIPVSITPVSLQQVEGNIPCAVQSGAIVAPAQINPGAPGVTQVLTSSPTGFVSWATGGGGGGNPGGNNGDLQFNSIGSFGGFTVGGDCTLNRPNFLCTKTNGVPFVASATVDTTNAANISSGLLPPARGGTGAAGPFSQGSVLFVGASGVFGQDNSNFYWNSTTHQLGVGTNNPIQKVTVNTTAGAQGLISFLDNGIEQWQIGKQTNNTFLLQDVLNGRAAFEIVAGNVLLSPSGGNTLIGSGTDSNYRLQVGSNGSVGTAQFSNPTGFTQVVVKAGATQESSGFDLMQFQDNAGNTLAEINHNGQILSAGAANVGSALNGSVSAGLSLSGGKGIEWSSDTTWFGATDVGLVRAGVGQIGVNNGINGSTNWRDLILRNLTISGVGGGGTQCLQVDNNGVVSALACTSGGTVTHTPGPLLAGRLVVGNSSNDVNVLGSLGTNTTVLHGNASGNPSFAAVNLLNDVTGTLALVNGGTGLSIGTFPNHFFFGNNTGGAAAPLGIQPAWSDLAAGTAGSVATFPGGDLFCGGVNAQTGASYTIATTDECKLTTFNNAGAVAVTLPQATTSGFTSGAYFFTFNRGAGAVTITPTTSTINGSVTLVLNQNQGAIIMSDGTNYSDWISAAPSGAGTVTSIATTSPITGGTITTTGTIACATCVTSAASLTANQLVIGSGSQGSQALGSLGTVTTVYHGNAGGAGSFGAVSLTADVSGLLPYTNLATMTSTQFRGLITDPTGTGAATFATDPTIAGPILSNEAEGTCNSGNRGKLTIVTGGAGVADTVRICVKRSDDTYSFSPVI